MSDKRQVRRRSISKFWMVLNATGGRPPTVRHVTGEEALEEARRLASLNPDDVFVVLEAMCRVTAFGEAPPVKFPTRVEIL